MKLRAHSRLRSLTVCGSATAVGGALLVVSGCVVGPNYHRPDVPTPAAYKENAEQTANPPAPAPSTPSPATPGTEWKAAQPQDAVLKGKWWEVFKDPELNALEDQVNVSNQTIAASFAAFEQARAIVRESRSQFFPTVSTSPSVTVSRQPAGVGVGTGSGHSTTYSLPFDASWTPDLWGRVRRTVEGNVASAQASAADLANQRLTEQADLAVDFYQLRGQDTLKDLLNTTVKAYKQSLDLTRALYETGIDSDEAVAQAETQLETTQAQATAVGITRAQLEHAIALLVGQPASTFSIPVATLHTEPPLVPVSVPSQLLERRPDIAASERLMAQANAQIGVAVSAYFPTLTLGASAGFESNRLSNWLTWPSRIWSIGPTLAETLFDAGLRKATVDQFKAAYDQTVANYRETTLAAFSQVEDDLVMIRLLVIEVQQQDAAVKSAERQLKVATDRYKLGIDPYLNVITAQTAMLSAQQTAVNLRTQQVTSTVQLVEALGGGWDASEIPTPTQVASSH